MKKLIFTFALLISFVSKADQLAYITKTQAEQAKEKIEKMASIYFFCGCCSMVKPEKVKVLSVAVRHTGYENYYEVVVEFKKSDGTVASEAVDLAYIWEKNWFKYKTVGAVLELEHDFCVNPKNWDDPANAEKDI
ncbi:MAG: hypothetical protein QNK77_08725 [Crocinitomicaceae bacterium]